MQKANMTMIGPTYPAHIAVSQAEVRLVADQTSNAELTTIKADEYSLSNAQEIEIAEAREVDVIA
jgi:hypothetical protein